MSTPEIDVLNKTSSQSEREAAWVSLQDKEAVDCERALKEAAHKLGVSVGVVKREYSTWRKKSAPDESEVHSEAGKDAPPDLRDCFETGTNLLPVAVAALWAEGDKSCPYTIDDVEAMAEDYERLADFVIAKQTAQRIVNSKIALMGAGARIGRQIYVSHWGSITKIVRGKDGSPQQLAVTTNPLLVCAEGFNDTNINPHLRLATLANGEWNDFVLSKAALAHGGQWQAILLNHGVNVADAETLGTLLKTVRPETSFALYDRPGWNGGCYVSPNGEVFGTERDTEVSFKCLPGYAASGSKTGADELIFDKCVGNSRLVLAVCAALAAPLLKDMNVEPGGFHFFGPSGSGKTTTLQVAGVVWGSGADAADGGIVGSWRSTDNGVEAQATMHNDGVMLRSEIKECKPEVAQRSIYFLGNGIGKQTMSRTREARSVPTFRCLLLSDGELSSREHIETERMLSYDAGAAARLQDIPADAGKGLGVFEELHGASSSKAFAESLKAAAGENYGHHGRTLLTVLLSDRENVLAALRLKMNELYEQYAQQSSVNGADQEGRVLNRFALCGAVGELAIQHGILSWPTGTAAEGVARCLADWMALRGQGSLEALMALDAFNEFLFSQVDRGDNSIANTEAHRNRAYLQSRNNRGYAEFWFTRENLAEACGQPQRVAPFLRHLSEGRSEDWELVTDKDSKRNTRTLPSRLRQASQKRMYCIVSKHQDRWTAATCKQGLFKRVPWKRTRRSIEAELPSRYQRAAHGSTVQ